MDDRVGLSAVPSSTAFRTHGPRHDPYRLLLALIKRKSVVHSSVKPIVGRYGEPLKWLIDIRPAFLDATALAAICDIFWQRYGTAGPIQIAALELSAVALVSALILRGRQLGFEASGLIIRKSRKKDGLQQIIEGTSKYGAQWRSLTDFPVHSVFKLNQLGTKFTQAGARNEPKVGAFETAWTFKADTPDLFTIIPRSAPLLDDDKLYMGMTNGRFYALSQDAGEIIWEFQAGTSERKGILSSPQMLGDSVVFGAYDGHLYALNKKSGQLDWSITAADYIGSSPCIAEDLGLIFIGLEFDLLPNRGAVAAFSTDGKRKVWSYPFTQYLHATPLYLPDQRCVATGSADGVLVLLDARTGKEVWTCELGSIARMAPAYDRASGRLFIGTMSGAMFAVNVSNGRIDDQWKAETGVYCTPLIAAGKVWFASTDRRLYAIDLASAEMRAIVMQGRSFCSPSLVGSSIFCGDNSGFIYEVDAESFEIRGAHVVADRVLSKIAYSEKSSKFFAQGSDNRVFCFEREKQGATT
jgi:outer membrane protein assembly factor BamB